MRKYKVLNFILLGVMFFGSLFFAIDYGKDSKYIEVLTSLSIFVTVLVPVLLKYTKYKMSPRDIFIYLVFLFLLQFLGGIANFYRMISWYDLFAHFLSGIFTIYVAYFILVRAEFDYRKLDSIICFLYFLGVVFLVAGLWEIMEFSFDQLLHINLQHNLETGVRDTMGDMIVASLGGIIGYFGFIFKKR